MLSQQQIFQPLNQQIKTIITQSQSVILHNIFLYNNTPVAVTLTSSYILLQQKQSLECIYYCPLKFDMKFQVLRKQWENELIPGQPMGICLEKQNINKKIQLFSNSSSLIKIWAKQLQKKINQRNFHKLFKAKRKIGKGAFAAVYLAQSLIDQKLFAVKAFSKEKQFASQKGRQSLQNEIKIMRNLNHQNLMKLQGVYQTQNSIYVILQYIEGVQLYEQIKNQKDFLYQQIKQIIGSLLKGLNYLSTKNIIHRDLKPQNIMLRNNNTYQTVICDFGLATFANEDKYLFVRCGTPGFVAPEIINIRDMNTKSQSISDVFSAGLIFHYLLLKKSIFTGNQYNEILNQNRLCQFDFNKSEYKLLNKNAFDLLKKMLETNPFKRITAFEALNHPFFSQKQNIEIELKIDEQKFSLLTQNCNLFDQKVNLNLLQNAETPSTFRRSTVNKKIPKKNLKLRNKQSIVQNYCKTNKYRNNYQIKQNCQNMHLLKTNKSHHFKSRFRMNNKMNMIDQEQENLNQNNNTNGQRYFELIKKNKKVNQNKIK